MAGFDNNVMYADNVDFTGSTSPSAQVTADGELLIGSTVAPNIRVNTLTAGTGITITNGAGSITIDSSGGFTWQEITGTSVTLEANNGYILNNAGLVTATLPATCVIGDTFQIVGKGAGGWRVAQNAGDTIHFGNQDTTTGAGGMIDSTNQFDCIEFVCTTADTDWTVIDSIGNVTVT